jgi:hypothetical protein
MASMDTWHVRRRVAAAILYATVGIGMAGAGWLLGSPLVILLGALSGIEAIVASRHYPRDRDW